MDVCLQEWKYEGRPESKSFLYEVYHNYFMYGYGRLNYLYYGR